MEPLTVGPWEAQGSASDLTRKGATCIARILKPGFTTAPTIVSSDIEGGRIVANTAYEIPGILGVSVRSRAKATLEAKDGRFRITFAEVEEFLDGMGWMPVRVRKGPHDAPRQVVALNSQGAKIAECVQAPEEDW